MLEHTHSAEEIEHLAGVGRVREAIFPQDLPEFMRLWSSLLYDLAKLGGEMRVNAHNLALYADLAQQYSAGKIAGTCLLYCVGGHPAAVLLWGRDLASPRFETVLGWPAQGWGSYVEPAFRRRGIASILRAHAAERMRQLGIERVVGMAHTGNEASYESSIRAGFIPFATVGILTIPKEA